MSNSHKITEQISFVSKQTVPVALGCSIINPKRIHLIQTPQVKESTKYLKNYFDKKKIKYHIHDIKSMRQDELQQKLDEIISICEGKVNFNLTNGTKLHTIATTEWLFDHSEVSTLYIDTQSNEVVCPKIGESWTYNNLPDILSFEDLLNLNGYDVEKFNNASISEDTRHGMKRLLEIVCNDDTMRHQLNQCASSAKKPYFITQDTYQKSKDWEEVKDICKSLNKLSYTSDHINFPDEEAQKWCNGTWLEDYVQSILFKLKQDRIISSFGSSVLVNKAGTRNELDAVFTVNNRLYTIECKTGQLNTSSSQNKSSKKEPTDYIYKLDSLQERVGGTFVESMFCSVTKLRKEDEERAKQNKITLITHKDLLQLESIIRQKIAKK